MNTKIFKIAQNAENYEAEINIAADVLKRGGLVVFPTETVYGLGADGTNADAVRGIYAAKGRPSDNPLIIHVGAPQDAEAYAYITPVYFELANRFMPGPLTVIMKAKKSIPAITRGGLETVAVRCPDNAIARALISKAGVPVAAPSANLSGTPSPTSAEHVIKDLDGRVDVIIDGGNCEIGVESTIVKIEEDGSLTLLRPGKITVEDLLQVVDEVKVADAVLMPLGANEVALSPGMKYKHYAPSAPLFLFDGEVNEFVEFLSGEDVDGVAVIVYSEHIEKVKEAFPKVRIFDFGSIECGESQAKRLFSILRMTDAEQCSAIYAPLPSKNGISLALYNRMIRAAAHKIIRLRR